MQINETFAESLKVLMKTLGAKGSTLARDINVDPSLVYKWLRNERVPSYSSSYIDSISYYFSKSMVNSMQQANIIKELNKRGIQVLDEKSESILNAVRKFLLEAQGYSIEIGRKASSDIKTSSKSSNKTLTSVNNINGQQSIHYNNVLHLSKLKLSDNTNRNSDNFEIVKGNKEIFYSGLALLHSISSKPDNDDDAIFITFNSNSTVLYNKKYSPQWKRAVLKVLEKGWTIIILIRLNNDKKRIIKFFDYMQFALAFEKFEVYYYKKNDDDFIVNELVVVPGKGALYCFTSKPWNQIDRAFLYKSEESIKLLFAHYNQFISYAKPLYSTFCPQISPYYLPELDVIKENLGNRYVYRKGISTITLPINIYEKYLRMSDMGDKEIELSLNYHKRLFELFKTRIKYFNYCEIWPKESIEGLVNEKKYVLDKHYISKSITPDDNDIVSHLTNTVHMLEAYENYEIAIVSKDDYENIMGECWIVEENVRLLIETSSSNSEKYDSQSNCQSIAALTITEREIVNAFQDYFMTIWNDLNNYCKQKTKAISWLKSLIFQLQG